MMLSHKIRSTRSTYTVHSFFFYQPLLLLFDSCTDSILDCNQHTFWSEQEAPWDDDMSMTAVLYVFTQLDVFITAIDPSYHGVAVQQCISLSVSLSLSLQRRNDFMCFWDTRTHILSDTHKIIMVFCSHYKLHMRVIFLSSFQSVWPVKTVIWPLDHSNSVSEYAPTTCVTIFLFCPWIKNKKQRTGTKHSWFVT